MPAPPLKPPPTPSGFNSPETEPKIEPPSVLELPDVFVLVELVPSVCVLLFEVVLPEESVEELPTVSVLELLVESVFEVLVESVSAELVESVTPAESVTAWFCPFWMPALAPTLTPTVADAPVALLSLYVKLVCHEA